MNTPCPWLVSEFSSVLTNRGTVNRLRPGGSRPAAPALVELNGALRNRFYEPLILLLAATQACMHNLAPKTPEPVPDRFSLTSEQLFHDFVNKMAQICDIQTGGDTVTAAVVLQFPDRVQYRFASNQRTKTELEQVRGFVVDILRTLQSLTEESSKSITMSVLQQVVAFNRLRLQHYVKVVATESSRCLEARDLAAEVVGQLKALQELSMSANNNGLDENICKPLSNFQSW